MKYLITALFVFLIVKTSLSQSFDIRVHDPVMIKAGGTYYLFCTGWGITVYASDDLKDWRSLKPVFEKPPQWALETIDGYKGHTWAPDISYHNGQYYLYYSVSSFGKNTSCIGLATNKTLDPNDPEFKWVDHGKVIQSIPGRDLWNAIDPNLAYDDDQQPWLVFGSFWSGIKLVKMNKALGKIAAPQEWYTVAKRERSFKTDDYKAGEAAIEAPFIFKKNGYYYLFVSYDACCRGVESTYKIMVGRADDINGPYLDKEGVRMDEGGASLVLKGNDHWPGVGHCATYTFDGKDYLIFHGYDATDGGTPKLLIKKIKWDNDWPVVAW